MKRFIELRLKDAELPMGVVLKKPTNADRIRSMSDGELNELFHEIYNAGAEDAVAYDWGQRTNSFEWSLNWLQQPAEEEADNEAD